MCYRVCDIVQGRVRYSNTETRNKRLTPALKCRSRIMVIDIAPDSDNSLIRLPRYCTNKCTYNRENLTGLVIGLSWAIRRLLISPCWSEL